MQDFERDVINRIGIAASEAGCPCYAPDAAQKKCSVCGVVKPLTEFSAHPIAKDGHNAACKECRGTARGKPAKAVKAAKAAKAPERAKEPPRTDPSPAEPPKSILAEAAELRAGARAAAYGDAVESFRTVSAIVRAVSGVDVPPDVCCVVMMAVKLARERYGHKRDNLVDLCGYTDILHLLREPKNVEL